MNRETFLCLCEELFGVLPDYPFDGDVNTAVLRHSGNRKWFAIVMNVPNRYLGIMGEGNIDIVNLKCAPEVADSFRHEDGIYAAYHMNKRHWLSVALDGRVSEDKLRFLMNVSFELTRTKVRRKA